MIQRLPCLVLVTVLCATSAVAQNTLLMVADDVGVDAVACYKEGTAPPPTPNIDALAKSGVLFRNAYTNPICSPTRATLLTGRYCSRTGVGAVVSYGRGVPLSLDEVTLPEVLNANGHTCAMLGKWHLGDARNGGDLGPNLAGFNYYAGHMWNLKPPETYFSWRKVTNGNAATSTVYVTTDNVNEAAAWIRAQTKPWVCIITFNAAHAPFHAPPAQLHTYNLTGKTPSKDPALFFKAMVQAIDTEIGRLFQTLGAATMAKTNVIFMGDNGTPGNASEPPFASSHAKTSLFEGGINVPLIVSGPIVVNGGRDEKSLVASVDVFSTVLELSGIDARKAVPAAIPLDGISFVPYLTNTATRPLRDSVYLERFGGYNNKQKDGRAIRNSTYKLIHLYQSNTQSFYDLVTDPFEKNNLLSRSLTSVEKANYDALLVELDRLRGDYWPIAKGCPGNSGVPHLALVGNRTPQIGRPFTIDVVDLDPRASGAIGVLGLSDAWFGAIRLPWVLDILGMPGCVLAASPDLMTGLVVSQQAARWTLPVPPVPALLGKQFFQQALVLEPRANSAGMITSHAGRATIGG